MERFILPAAVQVLLLSVQGVSYLLIQRVQGEFHDMSRPLDKKIPLIPQSVYIYAMWYPLLFFYPIYLYSLSRAVWLVYLMAIGLNVIVSLVIYALYPTSFQRPEPPDSMLSGKILRLLYVLNYKGLNCMPSMHCSQCFIILLSACFCGMNGVMPAVPAIGVGILAVMIVESTVLTKQHVIMDMLAALPVGIVCYTVAFAVFN
jgi:hypothetical protein